VDASRQYTATRAPASGSGHQGSLGYLSHVDGLRAVAILSVLGFHAAPSLVPGGFVGVDVFFVISGFLITSILRKEMAERKFLLRNFLARRARRIVPALAFVVLVSIVAACLILSPEELSEFGKSLTATALFGANIHFYKTTDYFALAAQERPLLHTWSLAIEEQFYIVWPLLLLFLTTWLPRKAALVVVACAILVSFALFQFNVSGNHTYSFYMPQCRAWELLIGALLALTIDGLTLSRRLAQVLAALGLTAIMASGFILSEVEPYPGIATLLATLGTAAVIVACNRQDTIVRRVLSLKPIVWVGLISYSLYLWHWPILTFARMQAPSEPSPFMIAALLAISFAMAWFSWRYVETPFRGHGGELRLPTRGALAYAASILVVLAGVGISIKVGNGWPWRLDGAAQAVYAQIAAGNPLRVRCDGVENIFRTDCGFGRPHQDGQSYDVAIFGDSNADHFVPMVAQIAKEQGLSGRQVTRSTCAPLLGLWRVRQPDWREDACLSYQQAILKFVEANPKLKLAILSASWSGYQGSLGNNGLDLLTAQPGQRDKGPYTLEHFLETTAKYLTARGVKVLILGQVPHWSKVGTLPIECAIEAKRAGNDRRACGISAADVRSGLAVSNKAMLEVASHMADVSAILGTDLTCDETDCYAMMDGVFLYRNTGHLNKFGSEDLAKYVSLPTLSKTTAQAGIPPSGVTPPFAARD